MKKLFFASLIVLFSCGWLGIVSASNPPDFSNIIMTTFCERAGGKWTGRLCIKEGESRMTLKEALGNSFEIIHMPDGRWLFAKKPVSFLYLGPPLKQE